ncbi:MAG: glucosamine-6-phosphate deaminase [Bryobacteraceae bacterium]
MNRRLFEIFPDAQSLGVAAAAKAASLIRQAIQIRGGARILAATGNSQLAFVDSLAKAPEIDWSAVDVFHLDEYAGIAPDHPASFRRWVKIQLADRVHPRAVHYLRGNAAGLQDEANRYSMLLSEAPIDIAFVGFGENGHIAFNDPHVADFSDRVSVKLVSLDEASRRQQVGEGHFPDLDSVPRQALTLTCPAILGAEYWVCCVPDLRKAKAVKCALEGPISTACPASLIRTHPRAYLYLDGNSASLLSPPHPAK